MKLAKWQYKVRCKRCSDVIWSKWDGYYQMCKCGSIAVDQTPYYARQIGEPSLFERLEENEEPRSP